MFNLETGKEEWNVSGKGETVALAIYDSEKEFRFSLVTDTQPAKAIAFSADGSLLLDGRVDGTIGLDPPTRQESFQGHDAAVTAVAFSPDGSIVVSGGNDRKILFWKRRSGDLAEKP